MFLALYSNVFHTQLAFVFHVQKKFYFVHNNILVMKPSSVRFWYLLRTYWQFLFSFSSERFWYLSWVSFWDFLGFFFSNIQLAFLSINKKSYIIKVFNYFSTALRCGSFSEKNIEKKHLRCHDKNYCYLCNSSISVIDLIVGSRNMIKIYKNMSL